MTELKTNIVSEPAKKEETLCMTCKKPTRYNYTLIHGNFLCEHCYLAQLPSVVKPEMVKRVDTETMVFQILRKSESEFIIECDELRLSQGVHFFLGDQFRSLSEAEEFIAKFLRTPIRVA